MAQYQQQGTLSSNRNQHSQAQESLLLQLPVVSMVYRGIKNWQSEFKPRHYQR